MDEEKCYIFKPAPRPSRRRRTDQPSDPFVSSLNARHQACHDLWAQQRENLERLLKKANQSTVDEIFTFLDNCQDSSAHGIPTAFVQADADITQHASFFEQLSGRIVAETRNSFALLSHSECTNLKTSLKALIQKVVESSELNDLESDVKFLEYDLEGLYLWMEENELDRLIIAFQDSEAFESLVLAEMIDLLSSWADRIPIVFCFGIATSVDLFQDRLPRSAFLKLSGRKFDMVRSGELLDQMFHAFVENPRGKMQIGPNLGKIILERQEQYIQSPQRFIDALQYAYLCHFHGNPLSVFLCEGVSYRTVSKEHFQAIRTTTSFCRFIEDDLVAKGHFVLAKSLIQSDKELFDFLQPHTKYKPSALKHLALAVRLIEVCRDSIPSLTSFTYSKLYLQALSGELQRGTCRRELLLSLKKAQPSMLLTLLKTVIYEVSLDDKELLNRLQIQTGELISNAAALKRTLINPHDLSQNTLKATVVSQKIQLSRQESNMSELDQAYSSIVEEFHNWLSAYLDLHLVPAHEIFLQEIFIFDLNRADRQVFMPKPRFAIERALACPHDYLGCDCCQAPEKNSQEGNALSATQPATALLYQLYLETGLSINVHDMWSAFNELMSDDETPENQTIYLFQRALAELKYLGFVRSTKKRADHISKVMWKGL